MNAILVEAVQFLMEFADRQARTGDLRDERNSREPTREKRHQARLHVSQSNGTHLVKITEQK